MPYPVPEAPVSVIPALFTKAMLKQLWSCIMSLFFFLFLDSKCWPWSERSPNSITQSSGMKPALDAHVAE